MPVGHEPPAVNLNRLHRPLPAMPIHDPALADWLRLGLIPGVGDVATRKVLAAFGLPENVFASSLTDLARAVGETQAARILAARHEAGISAQVDCALSWLEAAENHLVTLADSDYPRDLLDAPDPPPMLYLKGRRELLGRRAVAIVGSRNATAQGLANAENFANALSGAGFCVISGLALGIDAAAHRGALRHEPSAGGALRQEPGAGGGDTGTGSTIAVIGTGADIVYPARNRDLAHQIAVHGLIVSEFPLGTSALASNFPRRNRIISGLSKGVVVIEAALKSGSLITARLAGEQGREVFALPGSIHSPLAKGCHQLIKQGAKLVDSVEDILEELGGAFGPEGASVAMSAPVTASSGTIAGRDEPASAAARMQSAGPHAALLEALGHDPVSLDALGARSGLDAASLSAQLLELELAGRVAQLPGGLVQRLGA